jgi:ArsR family transcriptional regulator
MIKELERIFKALSEENRIRILKMLEVRPLCVCEMRYILKLAQSTVSEHLKILKDAGLIKAKQAGLFTEYQIVEDSNKRYVKEVLKILKGSLNQDKQVKRDKKMALRVRREDIICSGRG